MQISQLFTHNNANGIGKNPNVQEPHYSLSPLLLPQKKDEFKRENSAATTPIDNTKTLERVISPLEITSLIDRYVNRATVEKAIKENPNITNVLNLYGLQPVVSERNIDSSTKHHMATTAAFAREIAQREHLSVEETNNLIQAAALHDIGKALVPESILQKPEELTPQEREIINLHSYLGREILRTTGIDEQIFSLVKNHHTPEQCSNRDLAEILAIADTFSALKAKRPYKAAFSDAKAFNILYQGTSLNDKFIRDLELSRVNLSSLIE